MEIFFICIGVISVALFAYSLLLWRKSQKRSRFQARLTILFFLFTIIPTIPLTLSVGILLIKSTEMLTLPGVEEALSQSLDMIRLQLDQQGKHILTKLPAIENIDQAYLIQNNIVYAGILDNGEPVVFKSVDVKIKNELKFPEKLIQQFDKEQFEGRLVHYNKLPLFESYQQTNNNRICFIGFKLSPDIITAKNNVLWALRNHASMRLLRDTFLEQGLLWGIASVFVLLLAFISALAAKIVSTGISRPIQQLTVGMEQVGSGDLSHRVNIKAKDEIEFLVNSFNKMASDLKTSRENLQRAERIAAWRDVARQISHEIKNPLTPIKFSLFRLTSSLPEEFKQQNDFQESVAIIEEELASIQKIANEFSDFARMPQMQLKPENVDEIINNTVTLFHDDPKNIKFTLSIEKEIPQIMIDRDQIRRCLQNLIKNAIEASAPDSQIDIIAEKTKTLDITIKDQGCGMDSITLKKAMSPYFTTKEHGTGLGLFIVNRIIIDHGGMMDIQSEPGLGTRIKICLPLNSQ